MPPKYSIGQRFISKEILGAKATIVKVTELHLGNVNNNTNTNLYWYNLKWDNEPELLEWDKINEFNSQSWRTTIKLPNDLPEITLEKRCTLIVSKYNQIWEELNV